MATNNLYCAVWSFFFFGWAFCSIAFSATLDEQLTAANRQSDSLRVVLNKLGSQKAASRIDSLFQADSTLKVDQVRVISGKDSMWVNITLDKLSALDRKIVRAELKGAELNWKETSSLDTLYMRRDRAEKALRVISTALRE